MIKAIASLVSSGIDAWSERSRQKSELKRVEADGAIRIRQVQIESQVKRAEQGDESAISMDQLSFQQRGWKDDYLIILTTAPLLVLFIAPVVELFLLQETYKAGDLTAAVLAGFSALQQTPQWYLVALMLVYVDTFGFRRLLRGLIESRLGQLLGKK